MVVFPLLFATPQLLEFPIDFALSPLLSSVLSFVFPQLFAFSLFLLIFVPISHTFLISLLFILLAFLCCWIFPLFYSPLFFAPSLLTLAIPHFLLFLIVFLIPSRPLHDGANTCLKFDSHLHTTEIIIHQKQSARQCLIHTGFMS